MIMKTKKSTIVSASLKLLLVLPVIILVLVALSSCAAKNKAATVQTEVAPPPPPPPPPQPPSFKLKKDVIDESETTPFVVVEEMPVFPGGDSLLLNFISLNTRYPEVAKANKIQGRVIIRFCVTEVGSVDRISVLKGVDPELDAESIRVIGTLPAFNPGKQGGEAVPVWYMVPITFTLK